jgi:RNA polymerase sigma factor (sigma-70 family)
MAAGELRRGLEHLRQALLPAEGGGVSDGQLLARFCAGRDEAAFAALVRRHGSMVLGVCRRVLSDHHDAEDAFQAAFLILARKAGSVVKRQSLASWLYAVACRAALQARASRQRRRARETQVETMPHPEVAPAEPQDWRPLLDRELSRLPDKYRAAVVLCDLEGHPRREAARRLGLPEGTLSSRLAAGRRLLARRLTRRGLTLSGGALAAALAEGASASVPAPLVISTARTATLVAAGQLAAVSTPAALLARGVLEAMFMAKLKLVVGAVMVLAALGAGGIAYRAGAGPTEANAAPPAEKPRSELETLRRENELLKLNLEVVLEKVRSLEADVRTLKGQSGRGAPAGGTRPGAGGPPGGLPHLPPTPRPPAAPGGGVAPPPPGVPEVPPGQPPGTGVAPGPGGGRPPGLLPSGGDRPASSGRPAAADPLREVEDALKALRKADDEDARRRATDALEKALKKLRKQHDKKGTVGH